MYIVLAPLIFFAVQGVFGGVEYTEFSSKFNQVLNFHNEGEGEGEGEIKILKCFSVAKPEDFEIVEVLHKAVTIYDSLESIQFDPVNVQAYKRSVILNRAKYVSDAEGCIKYRQVNNFKEYLKSFINILAPFSTIDAYKFDVMPKELEESLKELSGATFNMHDNLKDICEKYQDSDERGQYRCYILNPDNKDSKINMDDISLYGKKAVDGNNEELNIKSIQSGVLTAMNALLQRLIGTTKQEFISRTAER